MLDVFAIPIFSDNYVWVIADAPRALVVDPGDAAPVQAALHQRGLHAEAVLVTHWHPDHIGGIAALSAQWPGLSVFGPRAEAARIPTLTHAVDDGDRITALGLEWQVLALPGHTLGHIAYRHQALLFSGDVLFSAGCGRLFEGTAAQMHASLARLAALPDDTQVHATHEYTEANLRFALAVEADNPALHARAAAVRELRAQQRPSLPVTLGAEKTYNPFLRCTEPAVIAAVSQQAQRALASEVEVFAALRQWKDRFR